MWPEDENVIYVSFVVSWFERDGVKDYILRKMLAYAGVSFVPVVVPCNCA